MLMSQEEEKEEENQSKFKLIIANECIECSNHVELYCIVLFDK
jgi:hypothetical protein